MKPAPALHTHARVEGVSQTRLLKVLSPNEAKERCWPLYDVLILDGPAIDGCAGVFATGEQAPEIDAGIRVFAPRDGEAVKEGDVIRVRPNSSSVSLVYRRGSQANVLFVTERCNSRCLMCSQPPRDVDDGWRVRELDQLISLIDLNDAHIGITGGEPTLLGKELGDLLRTARQRLPETHLHVLTNGRNFRDSALARDLVEAGGTQTMWAVPLYADVASQHDLIVDAEGAFGETIEGLFQLSVQQARVEIRIVLHALSVPRLSQLASYIYRRLPFVEHVTFMGLEPMGYTKGNRDRLWIDPADYAHQLELAVQHLAVRGMNVSIYNLSYCVLPKPLWRFARASISDWKNRAVPECERCALVDRCSGFFASAGPEWRSRLVAPIAADETTGDRALTGESRHELA